MSIQIQLPASLRRFAEGSPSIAVDATTVGDALRQVVARFPRLGEHLFAADGKVRGFINVFVNSKDVRHLGQGDTTLRAGDVIVLLPAIAGG